jgi:Tfp pilus assembly protein PilO
LLLGWYVAVWRPAGASARRAGAAGAAAKVLSRQLAGELAGLEALQRAAPAEEARLRQAELAVPTSASVDTAIDQINSVAVADGISWTDETQTLSTAAGSTTAPASTSPATTRASAATTRGTAAGATTAGGTAAGTSTSADATLAMTLSVAGTYPAMTRFITDLQHLRRLIVIDTITYSPATSGAVTATMSVRAFYNTTADPVLPASASGS